MVLVVFFELNAAAILLAFPVLGFLVVATIAVPILLWRRRPRQALACILGVSAVLATLFSLPAVGASAQAFWFRAHLPRYERMIDEARARNPASPVRLALEQRDLSLFVTSTHFQTIVYDESDAVLKDPCPAEGYGSCPRSVERIRGHFYRVDGF